MRLGFLPRPKEKWRWPSLSRERRGGGGGQSERPGDQQISPETWAGMRARETTAGLTAAAFLPGKSLEQARAAAEAGRVPSRGQPPTRSPRPAPRRPLLLPLGEALHQQPHDERQVLALVVGGQKDRVLVRSRGAALRRSLRRGAAATRPRGGHDGSARGTGSGSTSPAWVAPKSGSRGSLGLRVVPWKYSGSVTVSSRL